MLLIKKEKINLQKFGKRWKKIRPFKKADFIIQKVYNIYYYCYIFYLYSFNILFLLFVINK